jgi:hypothetical protein
MTITGEAPSLADELPSPADPAEENDLLWLIVRSHWSLTMRRATRNEQS